MPREVLRALDADVRRLFAAGGASAPADEGLRRRAAALRDLGKKVPALAQVAAAAERVTGAPAGQATAPLLDLLLLLGQVRASLAGVGCDGELSEIAPSGPWESAGETRVVASLFDAIADGGPPRKEPFATATASVFADLRLLSAFLALGDRADEALAELLALEVLPRADPQLARDLWPALCRRRRKGPWWLMVLCREHPAVGLELAVATLELDDLMLREAALAAIAHASDAAAAVVPALVRGLRESSPAARAAHARALGKIGLAARDAVPALCDGLRDESAAVRVAAADALGQIRSSEALTALGAVKDGDAPPQVREAAERAIARIRRAL